jgi:hypothetical protein
MLCYLVQQWRVHICLPLTWSHFQLRGCAGECVAFTEYMWCCCTIQQDIIGIRYAADSHDDLAYLTLIRLKHHSTCRPMQAKAFRHILVKLCKSRWLLAYTNSTTLCTYKVNNIMLSINPSQRPVFSVCPVYNCLYPCLLCYILISDHL